jgi:hypothetical protein
MDLKPEVLINMIWQTEVPDCTPCISCREPIFSTMYRLFTKAGRDSEAVAESSECVLCESCYNTLENGYQKAGT